MATKTWGGETADWNVGTDWTGGLPGSLDLAVLGGTAPYLVTIGTSTSADEFEHPGSLSIGNALATLSVAANSTLAVASLLDLAAGTLALALNSVLEGGTLDLDGGVLTGGFTTLDGVTVRGELSLGSSGLSAIAIEGGLTLQTASGAPGGTVAISGGRASLSFLDNETFDNATVLLTNNGEIFGPNDGQSGSLTLGSNLTLVGGSEGGVVYAATLANLGTILVASGDNLLLDFQSGSFTNGGSISVAAGGDLTLYGPLGTAQLQTLAAGFTDNGALTIEGALNNAGSTLTIGPTGSLAGLVIDSTVTGGTIVNDGALSFAGSAILTGVTVDGPVVLQTQGYSNAITFGVGTTLLSASGAVGGTLIDADPYSTIVFQVGETLTNALIKVSGLQVGLYSNSYTLTFGTGLDVDVTGSAVLEYTTTLVNAGTLTAEAGALVEVNADTLFNSGRIGVAAGGTLEIGIAHYGQPLDYVGAAPVLAAGSTLIVNDVLTTAQLQSLLAGQAGVTVELTGTLLNAGTSLVVGSGAIAALLIGGDVVGGTIDVATGTLGLNASTLDAVTLLGTASIGGYNQTVDMIDGITLAGTDGVSPGTFLLSGGGGAIDVIGTGALDNVLITTPSAPYYSGYTEYVEGGTLSLGAHATIQSNANEHLQLSATTLINGGTIAAFGSFSTLFVSATSIINPGLITVASGAALALDVSGATIPLQLSNPGAIDFATGAMLELGGIASTATLAGLLGTQTGVTVALLGTLQNAGTTITVTSGGVFSDLLLEGDLRNGGLVGAGGTVDILNTTLDGVALQGSFELGAVASLTDGVSFAGIAGSGDATVTTTGYDSGLTVLDGETLSGLSITSPTGQLAISAASTPTLAIGTTTTITLGTYAGLSLAGTTIANAGTITSTGTHTSVLFASGTILQTGVVNLGSSDVLGLDIGNGGYAGLGDTLSLTGSIGLAAGAVLELGEAQTTMQLDTLLAQISTAGVAVELLGTLRNAGQTLVVAPGLLGDVILDGDIIGGAVTLDGGTFSVLGGTLDGVQVQAPVTLTSGNLYLRDNTLFETAGGLPGGTIVSTGYEYITIQDTGSFDQATVDVTGGNLALTAGSYMSVVPLVLGSLAVFNDAAGLVFDTSGTEIETAARIVVNQGTGAYAQSAYVALNEATIVNTGSIDIEAGATLLLDTANPYSPLTFSNTGSIHLAAGATLGIGGAETTAQFLAILGTLPGPGVAVAIAGSINNANTTLDLVAGGTLGDVVFDGNITGGTIIDAGATVDFRGAQFNDVTWVGPLSLAQNFDNLSVIGSIAVLGPGGPGTITLSGEYDNLNLQNASVLDQLTLAVSGTNDQLGIGVLTLGPAAQTDITGQLSVTSGTLINDGTIAVTGSKASLQLQTAEFFNGGILTVGSGDVLGLGSPYATTAPYVINTGSVSLAAGATLQVGGVETTAQLLSLLGTISAVGVTVAPTGTIINTGATIGIGASTLLGNLVLDSDVIGGTIAPGLGTIALTGGTLDGVTWLGTLAIASNDQDLSIRDGLTLATAGGTQPGALSISGYYDAINVLDTETLDNAVVKLSGYGDSVSAGTLTFGPSLVVNVSQPGSLDFATLTNDGTINVTGSVGELLLSGTSFINNGVINVGSGDVLSLTAPYGAQEIALGGSGRVNFAAGATLAIGGTATTAQLLAIIDSLQASGVSVELTGEVINTGTSLDPAVLAPGASLILDGASVVGGVINDSSGSVTVLSAALDDTIFQGTLAVQGRLSELNVGGNLVVESPAGGLPGTVFAGSGEDFYFLSDSGTLGSGATLANIVLIGTDSVLGIVGPTDGPLDIASSFTSEAVGEIAFDDPTIVTAGSFFEATVTSTLAFLTDTFSNSGTILVGPAAAVLLGYEGTLTFSNTGSIAFATGSTLAIGAAMPTSQFESLVGSLVTNPGVFVGFGEPGTLVNLGTTLTITPTGPLSDFILGNDGAVLGGTIVNDGSASFIGPILLDDVTWVGPLTVALPQTTLELIGTSSVLSGSTASAGITLTGSADGIEYRPSFVIGYSPTLVPSTLSQTVSNTAIYLDSPGTTGEDNITFEGPGTLTFAAGVTIAATGAAEIQVYAGTASSVLVNQGSIFGSGQELLLQTYPAVAGGLATIVNSGLISVGGVGTHSTALGIIGAFVNTGLIEVSGIDRALIGSSFSTTSFLNSGTVILAAGATLDFLGSALNAGTIVMADGAETLRVDATGSAAASILEFQVGDTIDLGQVANGSGTFADGLLDIFSGTTLEASFAFPDIAAGNGLFTVGTDGHGGTQITTAPCFLAGTAIRTTEGEVPVEALQVGMRVPTLSGPARPIVWIGQRRVDCIGHPSPLAVMPIRVRAGAFAPGQPRRDLLLSPDHAVWQDGMLVPIQYLVNGVSIVRERVAGAHYFHVELDRHAVLFAEGLPAESYLDTGNRRDFANGGAALSLFPDFAARSWDEACAPLCIAGPRLAELRARLFAGLDSVEVAEPFLLADGRRLRPLARHGRTLSFSVPGGVKRLIVASECGVPTEIDPYSADRRSLGVALGGVLLAGCPLRHAAFGPGFHAPEADRRWTDGAGELLVGRSVQVRVLEMIVVERMRIRSKHFFFEKKKQKTFTH